MKIGAITQPISDYIESTDTLPTAHRRMRAQEVTALPVLRGNVLIGVLTTKDITIANLTEPLPDSEEEAQIIDDLHLSKVIIGTEDGDLDVLVLKAREKGASHVALVDSEGKPIGIVDLSPYQQHVQDRRSLETDSEILDESLKESFPASDPVAPIQG